MPQKENRCDGGILIKILFSVTYYIFLCLIFWKILIYELTFGIITNFSGRLAGICYFLFPTILVISPIIWKRVYKKSFYKCAKGTCFKIVKSNKKFQEIIEKVLTHIFYKSIYYKQWE